MLIRVFTLFRIKQLKLVLFKISCSIKIRAARKPRQKPRIFVHFKVIRSHEKLLKDTSLNNFRILNQKGCH